MTIYTGNVSDWGFAAGTPGLEVVFIPDAPLLGIGQMSGRIITTQPVRVVPAASGKFSIDGVPTEQVVGSEHTTVPTLMRVEWPTPDGGRQGVDVARLMLRATGGDVSTMADPALSQPAHVIYQEVEPVDMRPGWIWINSFDGTVRRRK